MALSNEKEINSVMILRIILSILTVLLIILDPSDVFCREEYEIGAYYPLDYEAGGGLVYKTKGAYLGFYSFDDQKLKKFKDENKHLGLKDYLLTPSYFLVGNYIHEEKGWHIFSEKLDRELNVTYLSFRTWYEDILSFGFRYKYYQGDGEYSSGRKYDWNANKFYFSPIFRIPINNKFFDEFRIGCGLGYYFTQGLSREELRYKILADLLLFDERIGLTSYWKEGDIQEYGHDVYDDESFYFSITMYLKPSYRLCKLNKIYKKVGNYKDILQSSTYNIYGNFLALIKKSGLAYVFDDTQISYAWYKHRIMGTDREVLYGDYSSKIRNEIIFAKLINITENHLLTLKWEIKERDYVNYGTHRIQTLYLSYRFWF